MLAKLRHLGGVLRTPVDQRTMADKMAIASALTMFEYAVNIVFRIGSTLIVTRLLSPEIFGLFAVIMTFQVIVVMLTDFGIRALIIVSDEAEDPRFLQTCWSVQIVRGLCLWGIVLVLALVLFGLQQAGITAGETVYAAAALPLALAASGFQLVLQGMESVNQHVHARIMRFGRITLLNVARAAIGPVLTIAIALYYPTVWALVIAGLIGGAISVLLTFTLFPGTPMRACWEARHATELFNRGKWIMGHSALNVLSTSADKIMLSAFLPAPVMGVYFLASQIIEVPHNLLHKIQAAMGLQFFKDALKTEDKAEFRRSYYRYRIPFDVLACVIAGGLLTAAPAVIDILYDPRYLQAGSILQILALGLPVLTLGLIRDAYSAQKRFRIMTLISVIQATSIWIGLTLALPVLGSTLGAFLAVALHRLPEMATLVTLARREGWIDLVKEVRFLPVIGVGALMGWGVDRLWAMVVQ